MSIPRTHHPNVLFQIMSQTVQSHTEPLVEEQAVDFTSVDTYARYVSIPNDAIWCLNSKFAILPFETIANVDFSLQENAPTYQATAWVYHARCKCPKLFAEKVWQQERKQRRRSSAFLFLLVCIFFLTCVKFRFGLASVTIAFPFIFLLYNNSSNFFEHAVWHHWSLAIFGTCLDFLRSLDMFGIWGAFWNLERARRIWRWVMNRTFQKDMMALVLILMLWKVEFSTYKIWCCILYFSR